MKKIVLLFLILYSFITHCRNIAPEFPSPQFPSSLTTHIITDHALGDVPAAVVAVPELWKYEGKVIWSEEIWANPANVGFMVQSPTGEAALVYMSPLRYFYCYKTGPEKNVEGIGPDTMVDGLRFRIPKTALENAMEYFAAGFPNARFNVLTGRDDLTHLTNELNSRWSSINARYKANVKPPVPSFLREAAGDTPEAGIRVFSLIWQADLVNFSFSVNEKNYDAKAFAFQFSRPFVLDEYGDDKRQLLYSYWDVVVMLMFAPEGQFEAYREDFTNIAEYSSVDPLWFRAVSGERVHGRMSADFTFAGEFEKEPSKEELFAHYTKKYHDYRKDLEYNYIEIENNSLLSKIQRGYGKLLINPHDAAMLSNIKEITLDLHGAWTGIERLKLIKTDQGFKADYNGSTIHEGNKEQWNQLLQSIGDCNVLQWERGYIDSAVADGLRWQLSIEFQTRAPLVIQGQNDSPAEWMQFLQLFKSLGFEPKAIRL
ncbi:MAG: hypothetical protein LBQ96_03185 [Fusobacteriaceae bacterium]|jgi:hypothetical protein|nr:hypothetical protein [Fusobacteriaceae bacterium]